MAKKNNITTYDMPAFWFIKHPMRSDLNFFGFDLDSIQKQLKEYQKSGLFYIPEVYEVQFYLKRPMFKKYTKAQVKKLNII